MSFTAKASGNVCTEDFVNMFNKFGIRDDVDLRKIVDIAKEAETFFGRELPGKVIFKRSGVRIIALVNILAYL